MIHTERSSAVIWATSFFIWKGDKMKTATIFLCDIYGTYKANIHDIYSKEVFTNFITNLEYLRAKDHSDILFFSFISQENSEIVLAKSNYLKSYVNNPHIQLNTHFYNGGYIHKDVIIPTKASAKTTQILNYIDFVKPFYTINTIYYADDTELYQYVIKEILEEINPEQELITITPKSKRGLAEVNEIIELECLPRKLIKKR